MLPVCCLKLPGGVRKKLQDSGFVFAEDLFSTNNELQKEVEKILKSNSDLRTVLKECLNPPHKLSAGDLLKKEETCQRILTFSYRLDRLLGGGLPVGCVTEVCGPPGSGKTQFCLQMCISVQLHTSLGGLQAEAVFIDTDAGFSPQRLTDIGQGCKEHCCRVARSANFSHDLMKILEEQRFIGYHYIAVQDYSQLLAVVVGLEEFIQKHTQVKIIVIDSLAFPFLQLSDMLKRTVLLCKILQISNRLALNYNLSVVVTNHLTTRISPGENQLIPALGESLGHLMTHRLMFGFLPNDGYFAAVNFKSPSFQNDSAEFQITKDGIRDVH